MKTNCIHNPAPVISTIHAEVDIVNPTADMIHPTDVAVVMARKGRYNDLSNRPFTVGQHLLLCDAIAQNHDEVKTDDDYLYIMLHDAHEAYIGDIPRPLKALFDARTPGLIDSLEAALDRAIFERFGCPMPRPELVTARKEIDNIALAAEKEVAFASIRDRWTGLPEVSSSVLVAAAQVMQWTHEEVFNTLSWRWYDLSKQLQFERGEVAGHA